MTTGCCEENTETQKVMSIDFKTSSTVVPCKFYHSNNFEDCTEQHGAKEGWERTVQLSDMFSFIF